MIRLPIKKLKQGMIIAQSIYNRAGGSYLVKGQPVAESYIRQLQKIGIPTVTVTSTDTNFRVPPPEDIVQESTRINAIEKVYDTYNSVEESGSLDATSLQDVSEQIIFDVINRKENLVQLTDIRLHDTYTFAHSVNVAILSAMLGLLCHFPKRDLMVLTLGALLHDLGKINVTTDILTKKARLLPDEFEMIKGHPLAGADRIKSMAASLPSAPTLALIAAQHHEHVDGGGYPNGLTGDKLHRYSKIVAIADVYDALTSERPYKKAYTPHIAYNIMMNVNKGQFDTNLLKLFFNNVSIYPVGTILRTIYGYGIVSDCQFGHTERPTIIVFADHTLQRLEPKTIDLSTTFSDRPQIEQVLIDNELRHFIQRLKFDPSIYLQES